MPRPTCACCKFFQQDRHNLQGGGACHFHPPVRLVTDGEREVSGWPRVAGTDWCGCFQPSNNAPVHYLAGAKETA
jgi:hypothetical protein